MALCGCEKCGKSMDESNFYTYKDGTKTEICKKCLTMHIDNFDPSTFLWLLEKMDVPYIEQEWNVLRDKAFAKDPYKMNGMSVFGKYLSKMKLRQWKDYHWEDTEKLKEEREKQEQYVQNVEQRAKDEELRRQFEEGQISEAEYRTRASTVSQQQELPAQMPANAIGDNNAFQEDFFLREEELVDLGADLTQEQKIALAMKWGRLYRPSEWVELESKYKQMMDSFDIQDADTINTLILLCKTDLKMNQAIDCGDMDGYQKLSRVYDSLRKSAKFTAAQKKEKEEQVFDAVGNLVAFCEKEGGKIPRYDIAVNIDKADEAIDDIKKYTKNLIYNDTNLAQQIEAYLKLLSINLQQKADKEKAKEQGLDYVPISDADMAEYSRTIASQIEDDALLLSQEEEEEVDNGS